jgi:uncharacterized protein YceH (UPF0502 family)
MSRLPRLLSPLEVRVLGCLLEKEQTTPDQYPLTVYALTAACNQRSNREPVIEVEAGAVSETLEELLRTTLVWRVEGARVERWKHKLERWLGLDPATKAVVTELLLRGPQTPGALRSRARRMHPFGDLGEVEAALGRLAAGEHPVVAELPRAPGQKESRWTHLLAEDAPAAEAGSPARLRREPVPASSTARRLARLEERLAAVEAALEELRER